VNNSNYLNLNLNKSEFVHTSTSQVTALLGDIVCVEAISDQELEGVVSLPRLKLLR
jgi:hypothetical protein